MLENLITDRTLSDYLRWKELRDKGLANMTAEERAEWDTDLKGAYNISDLNRVGSALNYLLGRLTSAGYLRGDEFSMPTALTEYQDLTADTFSAYLSAVETIRGAMSQKTTTPPTPADVGGLDFQGANDIEKILLDVEELINNMLLSRHYCGELFSGEI